MDDRKERRDFVQLTRTSSLMTFNFPPEKKKKKMVVEGSFHSHD